MVSSRVVIAALALGAPTACIGWLDLLNGPDFGLSLFYVVPIALGGWFYGTVAGTTTALQATGWWWLTDISEHLISSPVASAWNGFTRLGIYLIIGVGAALMRADRARLRDLLEREARLARTDSLTGLQNGRAFREHVSQDLARAKREGTSVTLVYLDIDNFKRVNDHHGHAAGDALLAEIAATIHGCLRTGDHAARLGGDEFGVLLWGADAPAGRVVTERLVASIRALGDAFPGSGVGASAGLATPPPGGATVEELLHDADQAMYEVKQAGKGTVRTSFRPPT
jgi:diguanylate cyclase (GGDEF)-like protein